MHTFVDESFGCTSDDSLIKQFAILFFFFFFSLSFF